jgi:hypothetical protein
MDSSAIGAILVLCMLLMFAGFCVVTRYLQNRMDINAGVVPSAIFSMPSMVFSTREPCCSAAVTALAEPAIASTRV